mmetsp:Transcript_36019/g.64397  ORF Transcript_36019/g.64397 Transcript_36019/m.64397 type:complete len:340 (+) Transcript_36019:465-1484(+)
MPVRTSTTYSTSTTACSKWFATSRTAKNYWRRPTGGRRRSHCCYTRSRCMGRRCGAPPSRSFVNFCTERREKRRGAAMLCGTASTRCASGGTLSRGGLTRARSMSCRMKPCWRWPPGVDAIRARSWFPPSLPLCRGASRTGSTGTAARRRKCRGWCRVTRRSCFACCHARRKGGCRGRRSTCCSWLAVATGSHPARPPKRPERTCGSGWSSSSAQSRPCTKTVGCSVRTASCCVTATAAKCGGTSNEASPLWWPTRRTPSASISNTKTPERRTLPTASTPPQSQTTASCAASRATTFATASSPPATAATSRSTSKPTAPTTSSSSASPATRQLRWWRTK